MNWWKHVVAMELRKILAYRSDFWITFVGQVIIQLVIARALWTAIFESSGKEVMEGFTLPMMTLYFLIVPIGGKILMGENIGFLSREIYDGSFTRYLIYPLSFFQYKMLTYITHSAFYGLQLILIYFLYHFFHDGITFTMAMNLFQGVAVFILAALAFSMFAISIELVSLWADNIWSLMVMVRFVTFFLGGSFFPINFFPPVIERLVLLTPFPYLVSFPIRTVMGFTTRTEMIQGVAFILLWGCIFALCASYLWKKGQKNYTGVGI